MELLRRQGCNRVDRLEQESLPRGAAHRAEEVDLVWSLTPKDADNGRVDVGTSAGREVQGPRQHEPVRHRQPPIEARKVVDEREVGRKHPEQILHRGLRPSTVLGSPDEVILPQNRRTQLQLGRNPSHGPTLDDLRQPHKRPGLVRDFAQQIRGEHARLKGKGQEADCRDRRVDHPPGDTRARPEPMQDQVGPARLKGIDLPLQELGRQLLVTYEVGRGRLQVLEVPPAFHGWSDTLEGEALVDGPLPERTAVREEDPLDGASARRGGSDRLHDLEGPRRLPGVIGTHRRRNPDSSGNHSIPYLPAFAPPIIWHVLTTLLSCHRHRHTRPRWVTYRWSVGYPLRGRREHESSRPRGGAVFLSKKTVLCY